jgi:hypothetical protein
MSPTCTLLLALQLAVTTAAEAQASDRAGETSGVPLVPPTATASATTTVAATPGRTAVRDPSLGEVTGTVASVDRAAFQVLVTTPDGEVTVRYDRSTLVYWPAGATTVLSIAPGMALRAGHDAAGVAYWIQVRPAGP